MPFADFETEKSLVINSKIFSRFLVFYRFRAKIYANYIIQDNGLISQESVKSFLDLLHQPSLMDLSDQTDHIKNILELLGKDAYFQKKLYQFDLPITQNFEKFVKLSLGLTNEPVTKAILRKAVLQSLFSYLRQTVGSCFATAPCLYILKRHPEYFFRRFIPTFKKRIT